MQGRIGTPRPPSLGARQQFRRRGTPAVSGRHRAQQSDVGGRERVGFAQLALEDTFGEPTPDLREILGRMLASARQQLTLVQDLLDALEQPFELLGTVTSIARAGEKLHRAIARFRFLFPKG